MTREAFARPVFAGLFLGASALALNIAAFDQAYACPWGMVKGTAPGSCMWGTNNTASGKTSLAIGDHNTASGTQSAC